MVEWKKLGDVCEKISSGKNKSKDGRGLYPVFGSTGIIAYSDNYVYDKPLILVARVGANAGFVHVSYGKYDVTDNALIVKLKEIIRQKYVYYYLVNENLNQYAKGGGQPLITGGLLKELLIPIPSKSEQERIVSILDTFTASIANLKAQIKERRKQYEYYRDQLLDLEGKDGVEMKTLPQISKNLDRRRKAITSTKRVAGIYPYYGASGIVDYVEGYIFDGHYLLISEDGANLIARTTPIAFSIEGKNWVNNHAHVLEFDNLTTQKYVEIYLNLIDLSPWINGAAQPKLNQDNLNKIGIPLPSLQAQLRIVTILDQFESSIANLEAQLKEREKQYEYYRNQLLTFE